MTIKKDFFATIFFKITLAVLLAHISTLFILCIPKISKLKKSKIVVHSSIIEKTQKHKNTKAATKPFSKNKKIVKSVTVQNNFAKDIEKCFQSLENTKNPARTNAVSLSVPEKIKHLKIQTIAPDNSIVDDSYEIQLINLLQEKLELPNFGTVKIKLSINEVGKMQDLTILQSKDDENVQYLKNQLHSLLYPCFNCSYKEEKIKSYIINFSNIE